MSALGRFWPVQSPLCHVIASDQQWLVAQVSCLIVDVTTMNLYWQGVLTDPVYTALQPAIHKISNAMLVNFCGDYSLTYFTWVHLINSHEQKSPAHLRSHTRPSQHVMVIPGQVYTLQSDNRALLKWQSLLQVCLSDVNGRALQGHGRCLCH